MTTARAALVLGLALVGACSLRGLDDLSRGSELEPPPEGLAEDGGRMPSEAPTSAARAPDAAAPDARTRAPDRDEPTPDAALERAPDAAPAPQPSDAQTANVPELPDDDAGTDPSTGTPDAGPEAPAVQPTGGLRPNAGPCSGRPSNVICDDFDTGLLGDNNNLRPGWSWEEEDQPVFEQEACELVDDGDHPGARSLRSQIGSATFEEDTARLVVLVPTVQDEISIEFDFLPQQFTHEDPMDNFVHWLRIQSRTGNDSYPGIGLDARSDGMYVTYSNSTASGFTDDALRYGPLFTGWKRVKMAVKYGESGWVRVWYDGVQVFEQTELRLLSDDLQETYVQVGLYSGGTGPAVALYDDVVIEYTP